MKKLLRYGCVILFAGAVVCGTLVWAKADEKPVSAKIQSNKVFQTIGQRKNRLSHQKLAEKESVEVLQAKAAALRAQAEAHEKAGDVKGAATLRKSAEKREQQAAAAEKQSKAQNTKERTKRKKTL